MANENLEELLHSGSNQITSKVFSEVLQINPEKSIVISAFSVMTPLALLAIASSGRTHDELLNAIGLPNNAVTMAVFSEVVAKLNTMRGIELNMANKIYIPLGYELNDKFSAVSRDFFDTEVANIDFRNSKAAAQVINAWVEDKTNHHIRELVDPLFLSSDTKAVLVNALYFKGSWMYPFNKNNTEDSNFYVNNHKVVKVSMMYNKRKYNFTDSSKLKSKILELPYAEGQSSMIVVLPHTKEGIADLKEKLKDLSVLDEEVKKMDEFQVHVYFPKFKIETSTDLKNVLRNINVRGIFSSNANLDKLLKKSKNLYVSDAIQKAFIEVNEEGTSAAASNAFMINILSSLSMGEVFVADHPFLFFLKANNIILFNGAYYETK